MRKVAESNNRQKQEKMNIILLDYGQHKEIMEKLNVSYPTIRKALRGEIFNRKAQAIRELAIGMGGRVLKSI